MSMKGLPVTFLLNNVFTDEWFISFEIWTRLLKQFSTVLQFFPPKFGRLVEFYEKYSGSGGS